METVKGPERKAMLVWAQFYPNSRCSISRRNIVVNGSRENWSAVVDISGPRAGSRAISINLACATKGHKAVSDEDEAVRLGIHSTYRKPRNARTECLQSIHQILGAPDHERLLKTAPLKAD